MTMAQKLRDETTNLIAWNMPVGMRPLKTYKNQHGTVYVFDDGSRAAVRKGTAVVIVIASYYGRVGWGGVG